MTQTTVTILFVRTLHCTQWRLQHCSTAGNRTLQSQSSSWFLSPRLLRGAGCGALRGAGKSSAIFAQSGPQAAGLGWGLG